VEDGLADRHQCVPPAENGDAPSWAPRGRAGHSGDGTNPARPIHTDRGSACDSGVPRTGRLRLDAWPVADLEFDNDGPSAQHRPAQADKHPVVGHREPLAVEAVVLARNHLRPYEAFKVRVLCQEIHQAPAGAFPGAEH